jgi:zinc protease
MDAPTNQPAASSVAPLHLPPLTQETLANGLTIVTARKTELPLVALRLVVRTGAALDPPGKEGLASLTGLMLRRGTAKRSSDQVNDAIESIGGLLGVDVGYEATSIAVTVPAEHVGTALEVMADLARNASFPEKEFNLEKRRELSQLQQDLDDPTGLAERALVQFYYGPEHPFGHPTEGRSRSVKTIKRTDLIAFHRNTFGPSGSILFFVGDIEPSKAQELARKTLGSWQGRAYHPLAVARPSPVTEAQILLVDKADATQTQVRVAVPGLARKDPGYFAAVVANTIVGGGFTSRLVDEVRVNRGLSYSVSTRLIAMKEFGIIAYSTFTRNDTVREILDVSFKVLSGFHDTGPTEEEVRKARSYIVGLYPGRIESIDQLAEALSAARLVDLPFESIEEYRQRVNAVDVRAAAETARIFPTLAASRIVVVGSAEKIRGQLEGLGTVRVIKAKDLE